MLQPNFTPSVFQPPARLVENGYVAIKKCRHGLFMYNTNDLYVGRAMDIYGEWAETEMELLGPILGQGQVVLDVGANIGTHTVFFAQRVGPQGRVFAFEPQRITYEFLCANIALNCLPNVIPLQSAVGEKAEIIRIPAIDPNQPLNFAALDVHQQEQGEPVSVLRLDDLGLNQCHLIKIDVEGMEVSVLRGAESVLRTLRPILFVENNTYEGSPETVQLLFDLGYQCWWHIALGYNRHNFFGNPVNIWEGGIPEGNMICVPVELGASMVGAQPVISPQDTWLHALQRAGILKDIPKMSDGQ